CITFHKTKNYEGQKGEGFDERNQLLRTTTHCGSYQMKPCKNYQNKNRGDNEPVIDRRKEQAQIFTDCIRSKTQRSYRSQPTGDSGKEAHIPTKSSSRIDIPGPGSRYR